MPITSLPTTDDSSAGRDKTDRSPVPNRVNFIAAIEWNTVKNAVVNALAALGLTDGSTAGSVLRKLLSFSGPRETSFAFFEDFAVTPTGLWTTGGTVAPGSVSFHMQGSTAAGNGMGLMWLDTPSAVGAVAEAYVSQDSLCALHNVDLRFRFKTPASFVGNECRLGVRSSGGTTYARLRWNGSGTLDIQCGSAAGGATASTTTSTTLSASTWYEGRIVITGGTSVAFYVNDALIGTLSGGTSVPQSTDVFAPFHAYLARSSGGAHDVYVDWYEVRGTRR